MFTVKQRGFWLLRVFLFVYFLFCRSNEIIMECLSDVNWNGAGICSFSSRSGRGLLANSSTSFIFPILWATISIVFQLTNGFREPYDFYANTKINLKSTALKIHGIKKKKKRNMYHMNIVCNSICFPLWFSVINQNFTFWCLDTMCLTFLESWWCLTAIIRFFFFCYVKLWLILPQWQELLWQDGCSLV